MKVQCVIPSWPGLKQHPKELEAIVAPYCPVKILDDPDDFFNAQWEKARAWFTGDALLWIMADVTLPSNFGEMYKEMVRLMQTGDVGWVAPNVSWTCYYYHKSDLKELEPDVYEVPNTDSLCFMIRGDVIRSLPYMDPNLSYMWGMDFAAMAQIDLMGLKTVRDYRFKVKHPNSTGYDIDRAGIDMFTLWGTFSLKLRRAIDKKVEEANNLKRPPHGS
jgi:hypothetical protein